MTKLVSIIMNCHNCSRYLRQAIDSIYSQSYQNWEIIFWDNCSTEDIESIIEKYDSRLKYFRSNSFSPLGRARNDALKKVNGDYIAFLDTDDMYLPEKLEKQVALMSSGLYAMIYAGAKHIDESGKLMRISYPNYKSGNILCNLINRYEINMQSVMLESKFIFENNLGFDENFQYSPDHNLFLRLAAISPVGVINEPLVLYRHRPDSLTNQLLKIIGNEYRDTLSFLETEYPWVQRDCYRQLSMAYSKSLYYDSLYHIYNANYKDALSFIKQIRFHDVAFFILYILILIRVPSKLLLKILRR